jgi:hypothetical protein
MVKHRSELNTIVNLKLPGAEIGVAEGLFSRDILAWGIKKLYMVDNWGTIAGAFGDGASDQQWHDSNYQNALKLALPFGKGKFEILRGLSVEMAKQVPDNSLGFVYLDACHTYECVTADLTAWMPKLVKGGVMAGHDYLMPEYGVYQAVKDFTRNKYQVQLIPENQRKDAGFYFINQ